MLLNWAKSRTALWLAGSSTDYPTYFMVGSGSGTVVATQTALINPWDRQAQTGSANTSAIQKVKWIGDWNSVEASGLQLREFGMCLNETGTTGSMWSRTTLPAITFDGTNELRIEETWEVY